MVSASYFRINELGIDAVALRQSLDDARSGAVVGFDGVVRDHHEGRAVSALRYEAYVELAEREGRAIVEEALAKFAVYGVVAEHRVGLLDVGEIAVYVAVSAAHRDAAFAACRYVIDEIKSRVAIWKHERYVDGAAAWIHPD